MRVLFVCSQNLLRSPTAEKIFASYPGIDVASAGTNSDAIRPVTADLVQWADTIFVMEQHHQRILATKFRAQLKNKRVVSLDIPDIYHFMDPELVGMLRAKVTPFLPQR